jgi:hypothetical protein
MAFFIAEAMSTGSRALAMAVLAVEHTMAQEEQERARQWRTAPAA